MSSSPNKPMKKTTSRLQVFESPILGLKKVFSGLRRASSAPLQDVSTKRISDGSAHSSVIQDIILKKRSSSSISNKAAAVPRMSVRCGGASLRGKTKTSNEDMICIKAGIIKGVYETGEESVGFAAVFDGHNGSMCSSFLDKALCGNVQELLAASPEAEWKTQARTVFPAAFARTDEEFLRLAASHSDSSGACAVSCLVKGGSIMVAHVGDCAAILVDRKTASTTRITQDHDARNSSEVRRVQSNGGTMVNDRLDGKLEPLRAFGNLGLKSKGLISVPEVQELMVTSSSALLLCSDGVTSMLTDQEIGMLVMAAASSDPGKCATSLLQHLLKTKDVRDDATLLLMMFDDV